MVAAAAALEKRRTGKHITRWVDVDHGGHFSALEEPATLTADIREYFRDLR